MVQKNNKEDGSEITDLSSINNIDDIRLIITNSKLTVQLSKLIFGSSFKDEYIVLFLVLLNTVDLHSNTKCNFLVSSFDLKYYNLAKSCLDTNKYTFVEILKCLKIMDSKRNIKILNEKIVEIKSKYDQRLKRIDETSKQYLDSHIERKMMELSLEPNQELRDEKIKQFNEKIEKQKQVELEYKERQEKRLLKKSEEKEKEKDNGNRNSRVVPSRGGRGGFRGGRGGRGGFRAIRKAREEPITTEPVTSETTTTESTNKDDNNEKLNKEKKRKEKKDRELLFARRHENSIKSIENKIRELVSYGYESSLSGNVVNIFKAFFKQVPTSVLQYFAIGQPKKTWREICDLLHLGPKDLSSEMPWFLSVMFGKPAPEGTHVFEFEKELKKPSEFTKEKLLELVNKFKPSYPFLRKNIPSEILDDEVKNIVATYEDIDVLIWWIHELKSQSTFIIKRIQDGESLEKVSVGTLLEKTLALSNKEDDPLFKVLFKATTDKMGGLKERFVLPPPISIFGDKSGSMEVAIRLSNIISFIISSLTPGAELSFFDTSDIPSPIPVDSLENLFKLNDLVRAGGGTSPGASIKKLLDNKTFKNYIVVVTDEEENGYRQGRFSDLFIQYRDTVNKNCKLVFVSFLALHAKGQMVQELQKKGVEPIQILFDRGSPDVSKVDGMLSSLSCESEFFKDQLDLFVNIMNTVGDKQLYNLITEKRSRLMSFGLNIELGIKNVLSLLGQGDKPLSNMELLMLKNNLNRLIKISNDNKNEKAIELFTNIQKDFIKLPKEEGSKFLFTTLNTIDRTIYISKQELDQELKQKQFEQQQQKKQSEGVVDNDSKIIETKSLILEGDLSVEQVSSQLNSDNKTNFISLYSMLLNTIELPSKLKVIVLCGAFQSKNYEFANFILYSKRYTFKEVCKVLKIIDSQRRIKQLESKIKNAIDSHENRKIRLENQSKLYFEKIKNSKDLNEINIEKDIENVIN